MKTLGDYHLPTKISREKELGEPLWVVDLNTGERVYREQIDGIDDSWKRLKTYLEENPNQYITGLYFRFRDHWEEVARDKNAFFFTNVIKCYYGGIPQFYFMGGWLNENNEISLKKYSIPELILEENSARKLEDPTLQDGLIWRSFQ